MLPRRIAWSSPGTSAQEIFRDERQNYLEYGIPHKSRLLHVPDCLKSCRVLFMLRLVACLQGGIACQTNGLR